MPLTLRSRTLAAAAHHGRWGQIRARDQRFPGAQGAPPPKSENFPDFAHYFSRRDHIYINPRRTWAFFITRRTRGGGRCDPPCRFETEGRRASRKKRAYAPRRVLHDGGQFFDPRSIFDLVLAGQRSNFREIGTFSTLQADIRKTKTDSDMKPSPTCSPCNSALENVSFKPLA